MTLVSFLSYAGGAASLGLGLKVLSKRPLTFASGLFGTGMALLGAESVFAGWSADAVTLAEAIRWQYVRLLVMSWLPGVWLSFSLCYSRGNYREFLKKSKFALIGAFLIPVALGLPAPGYLLTGLAIRGPGQTTFLSLGITGVLLHISLLVSLVLSLVNLERTLRTAAGTMRWRIKFVVLGFAVLFGVRIYASSQAVLFSAVPLSLVELQASALLVACGLMALSFKRAGLLEVDVYPSQSFLYASLTVTLTGIYLLVVGLFAKIITLIGGDRAFVAKAFVIMVALVGLALLFLSDRVRQQGQRFVSRHLRRPLHDYRKIWTNFTGRTISLRNEAEVCDVVVKMVSETFNVLSVTLWLVDEQMQQLVCSASTSLSGTKITDRVGIPGKIREILLILRSRTLPFDLETSVEGWVETIKEFTPDYFKKGGHRICVPLVATGQVLGLMTLSDRVSGAQFSTDDFDLLHCMGDQVAATLLNAQLSVKLLQVKELEAFQAMAAFFVHDLKNTASTLSLMLENLPRHFNNPAFREDALRSIGATVQHVNELISRLTVLRHGLQISPIESDLNELVTASLDSVRGAAGIELNTNLGDLPKLQMDPTQMRNVIVNLLLNAKEALGATGQISVESSRSELWAVLKVADDGPGMSREFISRSLFRPFQTTKKKGLGIGLFQSKMIVEAHRGKLEVESEPGKGAAFRVLLPLKSNQDESKIVNR